MDRVSSRGAMHRTDATKDIARKGVEWEYLHASSQNSCSYTSRFVGGFVSMNPRKYLP